MSTAEMHFRLKKKAGGVRFKISIFWAKSLMRAGANHGGLLWRFFNYYFFSSPNGVRFRKTTCIFLGLPAAKPFICIVCLLFPSVSPWHADCPRTPSLKIDFFLRYSCYFPFLPDEGARGELTNMQFSLVFFSHMRQSIFLRSRCLRVPAIFYINCHPGLVKNCWSPPLDVWYFTEMDTILRPKSTGIFSYFCIADTTRD